MAGSGSTNFTDLLHRARDGDEVARDRLIGSAYQELRKLAAYYMQFERPSHTLQPTALVHEVYLKIFGNGVIDLKDRAHFFAMAGRLMRRILVDHARMHQANKRGFGLKVQLDAIHGDGAGSEEDPIEIDLALQDLEKVDARASQVVELKFFGGMTDHEVADAVGRSFASVRRDWDFARAWLFKRLGR